MMINMDIIIIHLTITNMNVRKVHSKAIL
jgi:uncharacterized OsmC-like protein